VTNETDPSGKYLKTERLAIRLLGKAKVRVLMPLAMHTCRFDFSKSLWENGNSRVNIHEPDSLNMQWPTRGKTTPSKRLMWLLWIMLFNK